MPLRMCIANPIALAALAVIAIGFISYQLISKQKKRIPIRERRPIDYPDNDHKGPKTDNNQTGVRKRHNTSTGSEKPGNENIQLKKPDDAPSRSKIKSVEYCNENHFDFICSSSAEKSGSFNNLNSLNQGRDENNEIQNVIRNINQEDAKELGFVKTVDIDYSDTSESNTSIISSDIDVASSIAEYTEHVNVNDFENGSRSIMEPEKSTDSPLLKDSQELYKKEVRDRLKEDVKNMNLSDCSDKDSNFSENDDSDILQDFSDSFEDTKKAVICKGCEENFANAVAYPCGHNYLCLDCAIKVHRIYKKCTICNFRIETYDI